MTSSKKIGDESHSSAELAAMLRRMRDASNAFYGHAFTIGNHAFIEFAGLMNEYIGMCENAAREGRDFTQANVHTGHGLIAMQKHHAEYLGEKFGCIFAASFGKSPKLISAFIGSAFNRPAPPAPPKPMIDLFELAAVVKRVCPEARDREAIRRHFDAFTAEQRAQLEEVWAFDDANADDVGDGVLEVILEAIDKREVAS